MLKVGAMDGAPASAADDAPPPSPTSSLDGAFAALESRRRRVLWRALRTIVVLVATLLVVLAAVAFIAWLGTELPERTELAEVQRALHAAFTPYLEPLGAGVAVAAAAWIGGALFAVHRFVWRPRLAYVAEYKRTIFAAVCAQHFPGLRYEPGDGIGWRVLDESQLFPFASDVYRSDDRFSGRVGATQVTFAEAVAQRERRRGFGKNRETVDETYFRGIVFSADFNKHFTSTTRLLPKGAEAARIRGEERAELEDPRFAAAFDTWTTDQVDVRYVLSPSLMERFTALSARFPRLRARFAADALLLLLPDEKNRFEPSLLMRADSRAQVDDFVADVRRCLGVVEALDLNTRIWSKA